MSVKAIMQWELEQMDLLEKLANRMEWEEDYRSIQEEAEGHHP